jgi:hypothetical protein
MTHTRLTRAHRSARFCNSALTGGLSVAFALMLVALCSVSWVILAAAVAVALLALLAGYVAVRIERRL